MPERHLLPIPLPHGRDGSTGFLSVFMSPRLKERGELQDYPEWLRWPDFITATGFQVSVNGVVVPSAVVSAPPDTALWSATFADDTAVAPHRFEDWTGIEIVEVPTSRLHDAVLDLYTDVAVAHPTHAPTADGLVAVPSASLLTADVSALTDTLDSLAPLGDDDDESIEAPRDPAWDFHAYLSLLGSHPQLLRQLGLIVDLEVSLPPGPPGSVSVQTHYPVWFGASGAFEVPIVTQTTPGFTARPHPPGSERRELDDGFFLLDDSFATILDTNGAAANLAGLGARLTGLGDDDPATGAGGLPVLSTRALTLVRPDQTKALTERLERQAEIERDVRGFLDGTGAPPVVFAEDVIRGHRVDVLDLAVTDSKDAVWRSLFERTSAEGYHFPADPKLDRPADDDEGWGQLLLSTEVAEELDEPNADLDIPIVRTAPHRTTEAFHRWDNWSGAVPRPSQRIDATTGELVAPDGGLPTESQPVQFAVDYQARPGSLPRLRCTHPYRLRARAVDLSGWSPAVADKNPDGTETLEETFGRLEPIAAPTVVRRTPRPTPGVGDLAATIVLKSDYDIDDSLVEPDERMLFPGEIGHDLVELHGLPAGGADPASHAELAARSAASPDDGWVTDAATGEPVAEGAPRDELDYLVDPMVGDLRAEHYGEREVYVAARTDEWPVIRSNRVVAVAGDAPTEVSPDDETDLRVHLPKAEITSVDLSYAPAPGMLEHFGLWHQFDGGEQDLLRSNIESGAHWMFSARQRLSLVHAVRRPLTAPRTTSLTVHDRSPDSTAITFDARLDIDRRSTGSVAVRAHWVDLVDDPSQPAPEPRPSTTLLGRFDTPRLVQPAEFEIEGHHADLGDTRRHLAHVSVEAISSFSHYFTEELAVTVELGAVTLDERGVVPGTVVVMDPDGHRATPGVDFIVLPQPGTLRFPASSGLTMGADVTVRYVPRPNSRSSTEHGVGVEVLLPNTAVPPHPVVIEVAPAARRSTADGLEHDGRVVRVHLARPWNATGDGETLAVVLDPAGDGGTRVARDPIVHDHAAGVALTSDDFPLATGVVPSDDGTHTLVLHQVVFDEQLGHWIADIGVTSALYRPFLELVLARHQGDSIPGRHDGPTVTLEPIRLGVARTVHHVARGTSHEVTITGTDHLGTPAGDAAAARNTMTVRVQAADPTMTDPVLRWTTDVDAAELVPTTTGGDTNWAGTITVPDDGLDHRLVIEEVEPGTWRSDPSEPTGQIVYTEVIELDA